MRVIPTWHSAQRVCLLAVLFAGLAACASAPPPASSPQPPPAMRYQGTDVDVRLPGKQVSMPSACTADPSGQFPWPPPEPTDRVRLDPRLFGVTPGDNTPVTAVAKAVQRSFRKVGHVETGFQSIGCDGFAMISQLERIHTDGRPFEGRLRFLPPDTEEPWSLTGYLRSLLFAPEGKYRQIVILGTDKQFTVFSDAPSTEELEAMMDNSDPVIPNQLSTFLWRSDHELVALIYEYERPAGDGLPLKVPPRGIGATNHLLGAGFLSSRN
jgi:hypothetical protein